MKKKRDLFIDYELTYKRRGNRGKNRFSTLVLIVLLALGFGTAAYLSVKAQIDREIDRQPQGKTSVSKEDLDSNNNEKGQTDSDLSKQVKATEELAPLISEAPPSPTEAVQEVLSNPVSPLTDRKAPSEVKGVYVTASTASNADLMDKLIELAEATEINAMVIDVKDDQGKITYSMNSDMAKDIGAVTNTIPDMEGLLKELKEKGIYLIARIVAFKDPYLAKERQDLAIKNPDGSVYGDNNGEGWVNPYLKDVWDYLIEVATEAASSGFDEIQFDYIRFSTGKGIAQADFGETAENKSKEDIITEFTKYAYEKLRPLGIYVSADVYGTIISSSIDAGLVGQNYVEMAKYLDYICPMIYPSHFGEGNYGVQFPDLEPYKIIRKVLTASEEKLNEIPEGEHRAVVRPWLQDFTANWIEHYMEYGGQELREQINGVYSVGYEEWLLWNASCSYSEDGLLQD